MKHIFIFSLIFLILGCSQEPNIEEINEAHEKMEEIQDFVKKFNERNDFLEECSKMSDGINCIETPENEICTHERYNEEVHKINDCGEKAETLYGDK